MPHRKKNVQQQRQWRRMDLHLHTPASVDYKQPNVSYLDFLKKAEEKNVDIIAFADHNTATGYARYLEEVESLELLERLGRLREDERARLQEYRRLQERILVLPGFEFTATLGFHILGIFPPETTVRELEHLLLMLRVPPDKLDQGSGEVGATTDALTAYRMINEAGGLVIAAHANSSHGVAMPGFDFGGQTRIAYTQDPNLHALEVTDLESKSRRRTAAFFSGTKPEYPRRMHCIQGSDAHKLDFEPRYKNEMGVGDRATEILLDDLTFDAIKDVLQSSDFARTRPYRPETEEPFDPIRAAREQGDSLVQSFHERLHEKRGVARAILEDVVALANTNGGTIYIGASSNPKTPVVGVDRPDQASVELRSTISKEITPPLEVQVDVVKSQSKSLLQVIVPRGSEAPYALEGTYIYVRSENETGLAMRDEVVQLVRDALAVEFAASGTLPPVAEKKAAGEESEVPQPVTEVPAAGIVPPIAPPRTGVEIVSSEVRKGVTYYSVRDLRNNRIVQNVTRASARRLWQYAIEEQEKHSCDPSKVTWIGNIGACKNHKRGGKMRFDLVQRVDGHLFIYYGVTEDGIHGEWRKLVESENGEGEETAEGQVRIEPDASAEVVTQYLPSGEIEETVMPAQEEPEFGVPESLMTGAPEVTRPPETEIGTETERVHPEVSGEQPLPSENEMPVTAPEQPEQIPAQAHEEEQPPAAERAQEGALASEIPTPPEEIIPAHEATTRELEQSTEQAEEQRSELQKAEPPVPAAPPAAPVPPAPKTRAQAWREALDRAMAEARAASQGGAASSGSMHSDEQANDSDKPRGERGKSSNHGQNQPPANP